MTDNHVLSRLLLEQTLRQYQPVLFWFPRVVNPAAAKFAGEAALLLEFHDLVESFRAIALRRPKNVKIPNDKIWAAFTTIRDIDTVAEAFPILDQAYIDKHIDSYVVDDFQATFANAKSEYEKECILITQIMKQQVQPALSLSKMLSTGRMWNIHFVATIESFRCGDWETGKRLLKALPRGTMCEWGKPQMALGIAGRAGWGGYPYPDY